jgi:hypothetical protein
MRFFLLGSDEPKEIRLLPALPRAGDTCVDVGADWKNFPLIAAARVRPSRRCLPFA